MTHPALQQAMDGCRRLAEAAGKVGSPDPIAAIQQIDYDPQAVDSYVQQLRTSADRLDQAIAEHEKAIAQHEESGEGSASDSAGVALSEELAELKDERKRLETLITEVESLAKKMDELARTASDEILKIAQNADPAVSMVLDGSWLDDLSGAGGEAEDQVHSAVNDVIRVCQNSQQQVAALRAELTAKMDDAEVGGGAETGGGAEAGVGGGAEAGAGGSGQSQGGEVSRGEGGTTD